MQITPSRHFAKERSEVLSPSWVQHWGQWLGKLTRSSLRHGYGGTEPTSPHRRRLGLVETLESRCLMATFAMETESFASQNLLVQFDRSYTSSQVFQPAITSIHGLEVTSPFAPAMRQLTSDGWYQVTVPQGLEVARAIEHYQTRTDVVSTSPDFRVQIAATANDPGITNLWGLENSGQGGRADADIDVEQAWKYGTSSSVIVAVIDTGVDYNHVDLASNIWSNVGEIAGNGLDDDRNGYVDDIRGWNFANDNNNPMDNNGHGTHVAGTIGAVGNNATGISGINWNVQIMPLKFLDAKGSGMISDAVAAIDYARINGAKIINASWGSSDFSSALQSAIARFQSAGGIFIAAAGNEGANNAVRPSYPANISLTNVISVAASTSSDTLANFSNYGANVDIAAPGSGIYSTLPNNRYGYLSGTSMAAPHVAGAMALLWGQNPSLSDKQLIDLVMKNTDAILRGPTQFGRLNIGSAAAAAKGDTATDTVAPYVMQARWERGAGVISSIEVEFSEAIRSSTLNNANASLTGPDGAIAISGIRPVGSEGKRWRIDFAKQTTVGNYTFQLSPQVADLAGNRLDTDRDGKGGEASQDGWTNSTTLATISIMDFASSSNIAIRDASRTTPSVTTLPVEVKDPMRIADLNVSLNLKHTYVSDLRIRLIAPNGTSVLLFDRRGGSRDDLNFTLDDQASTRVGQVLGNFRGRFRSEQALARFNGMQAQGTWQLEITDMAPVDTGTLLNATLQIQAMA